MVLERYFPRLSNTKKILLLAFGIIALFVFITPFQNSFASTITYPVGAVPTTVTYRDISNTDDTPPAIMSLNPSTFVTFSGQTITITVNDFQGDLDTTAPDSISALVTMSSVTSSVSLEENGVNTHIFEGTFAATSEPSVDYFPDFPENSRASVTLDMTTAGSVTITDIDAVPGELGGGCIRPVSDILSVDVTGTLGATHTSVTMSYAMARSDTSVFVPGDLPVSLDMFYRPSAGPSAGTWVLIRDSTTSGVGFVDFVGETITSDPATSAWVGFGGVITEGDFVIGYDIGCPGGGGGGFTRAGLVVNALAGVGSGGGGGIGPPGPTITLYAVALNDNAVETISMPQEIRDIVLAHDPHTPLEPITDVFEDYDLPLSINGNGFALGDYENTLVTQTIQPGEPTEFNIVFYTNSEIAHTSLNFNLGPTRTIAGSDTQVLLYKDKPAEIIDSNGNIASATGSINNEGDLKRVVTFSITFSEDIQWSNSDLVIRAWNDRLNSGDTIVFDAIEIAQPEIVEIADGDIPEPEIQTLKSQYVPIWIKNNAAWWSQELIDDSDFVAGIEYLIQQEIITLTETGTLETNSSDEIPSWIKNNAGWWSEDLITEKEFIDGVQWLISNGIIKVVEI